MTKGNITPISDNSENTVHQAVHQNVRNQYSDILESKVMSAFRPNFLVVATQGGKPKSWDQPSRLGAMNQAKYAVSKLGYIDQMIYKFDKLTSSYVEDTRSMQQAFGIQDVKPKGVSIDTREGVSSLRTFESQIHSLAVSKNFSESARAELASSILATFKAIGGSTSELHALIDEAESDM